MQKKLKELKWEILSHLPYSSNLAPSGYHLFRLLQNSLEGRRFKIFEDTKNHIKIFFDPKPSEFYWRGISQLPERWEKLSESKGNTFLIKV
jgi:histone-lysine N-methyltransferase SETMAR